MQFAFSRFMDVELQLKRLEAVNIGAINHMLSEVLQYPCHNCGQISVMVYT